MTSRDNWPEWAQKHFPSTREEALNFKPLTWHYALHMRVLVAATTRIEGTWSAYCHPVPGISHKDEVGLVLDHGDKVGEELARVMFPYMAGIPYDG